MSRVSKMMTMKVLSMMIMMMNVDDCMFSNRMLVGELQSPDHVTGRRLVMS